MRSALRIFPRVGLLAGLLAMASFPAANARTPDPDPRRLAPALEAFAREDAGRTPPADPVVFVGSSSIRYWDTGRHFPTLPVVKRGLAGAHISDLNRFVHHTVLRYAPAVVVFYAGDNDIADGKSAARVAADYERFVEAVLAARRDTRIVFLPIKPSLARWPLWPAMRAANAAIRRFSEADGRLHYVDLTPALLDASGRPRPELLAADGLHLSAAGYRLWSEALAAALRTIHPPGVGNPERPDRLQESAPRPIT